MSIYGGGPERRVVSGMGELRETGPGPVRRIPDSTLLRGETVVEEEGTNASATSVTRTVYDATGKVLHDETWNTSYRGEYRVIRFGTKPPPPPTKPPPQAEEKPKPKPKDPAPPPTEQEIPEPVIPAPTPPPP